MSESPNCLIGLQAFREHKLFDPLLEPGTADLTADVDFKYLAKCVSDKGRPIYFHHRSLRI